MGYDLILALFCYCHVLALCLLKSMLHCVLYKMQHKILDIDAAQKYTVSSQIFDEAQKYNYTVST